MPPLDPSGYRQNPIQVSSEEDEPPPPGASRQVSLCLVQSVDPVLMSLSFSEESTYEEKREAIGIRRSSSGC